MRDNLKTLKSGLIVNLDSIDAIRPIYAQRGYGNELIGYTLFVNGSDIEITTSEFKELKEHL